MGFWNHPLQIDKDVALQTLFSFLMLTNSREIEFFVFWCSKRKWEKTRDIYIIPWDTKKRLAGPIFACNHVVFKAVASFIAEILGKHVPVSFYYS